MKKCLLFLMVCLMATGAYATNSWVGPTGSWSTGSLWGSGHMPNGTTDGEAKILKTGVISCTIDSAVGNLETTRITVNGASKGACTLYVVAGGSIGVGGELISGSGSGGGQGVVGSIVQTGGTVTLNGASAVGKLEVGYKSASSGIGQGYYTMSGGTLNGTGSMYIGAFAGTGTGGAPGAVGTFTVVGNASTIDVGGLYVGVGDATGVWTGTATTEFQVVNGAVSPIRATNVYIDPMNQASAITTMLVSSTGTVTPGQWILLVNNTDGLAVQGAYDTLTLPDGWTLSYVFDAGTMTNGGGNDIAVYTPEPATIALLSIGLLAIRRRK
jgi:hypothetical protein